MSIVLGLTGGIASGKSTVSHYLKELGYPVIDADLIAREVMEPDKPAYHKVIDFFGPEIVNKDQSINRKRVGEIVFSDPEKLKMLNEMVHSEIFSEIMKRKTELIEAGHPLIVLDIPLLYETGYDEEVDCVMVIYIDSAIQLNRLKKRDELTDEEAIKRIESQESLEMKKDKADVVINNNGTIEQTMDQIDNWLTENGYSSPL